MRGEELEEAFVGFSGLYGDRLFAFRSTAAPKGFPYLTGREQQEMLLYRPRQSPVKESLMSAHRPLHLFEAKSADTRISRAEPAVARLNFSLANGEVLVVEVPRYVLERLLVRAKRAIEAAPLLARGRSTGHSAHPRNK